MLDPGLPSHDDEQARAYMEALRWPHGPVCPNCGHVRAAALKLARSQHARTHARSGVHHCRACRKQFTVTLGTILEDSHVPLGKWLQAIHLLCTPPRPVKIRELQHSIGVTYKTAWSMAARIARADSSGLEFPQAVTKVLNTTPAARAPVDRKKQADLIERLNAQTSAK